MSGPLIVGCIGSSDPLIREYVHDYGLCSINLTLVEEVLRLHLVHRDMLRAEWHAHGAGRGLKVKKYAKVLAAYATPGLGGLISKYAVGGDAGLVGLLEPIRDARNALFHNHQTLSVDGAISAARIQDLRTALQTISDAAREASHAIQLADADMIEKMIDRLKSDGVRTDALGLPLEVLLAEHRRVLRLIRTE